MIITIHCERTITQLVNKTDKSLPFKKREGCKPSLLKSAMTCEMPSKINLSWKKRLSAKIEAVIKDSYHIKKVIIDNSDIINVNTNNAINLSNVIANYILTKQKPVHIDNIGNHAKYLFNKFIKLKLK